MIRRLVNLPFKVLGRAARAVQAREAAAAPRSDGATASGAGSEGANPGHDPSRGRDNIPQLDTPEDFDAGDMRVNAADVVADLQAGRTLAFVDLRDPTSSGALTAGIPLAQRIPLATLGIQLAELPPAGHPVIVYDEAGQEATDAVRFLRWRGIDDAVCLDGGLVAWRAAGGPVSAP
jgi:rhodanese-related sulfurtransferase